MPLLALTLTFRLQVDVLVWARLGAVHNLPQDDGEAVDVAFGRHTDLATNFSQKFWCCPVHIYTAASQRKNG